MWNEEIRTGEAAMDEAEEELTFELGRGARVAAARSQRPLSRPRSATGFRRPPGRPRPRGRRAGGLIWDEPLVFAPAGCPGPWNGSLDDPQSLRSLQGALNQLFDQLIRRAEAR